MSLLKIIELQDTLLNVHGEISGTHVLDQVVLVSLEPDIRMIPMCDHLHELSDAICIAQRAKYHSTDAESPFIAVLGGDVTITNCCHDSNAVVHRADVH